MNLSVLFRRAFAGLALVLLLALATTSQAATRPHVLVISIDGMRPDYVTHADEHHLRIPTLRAMLKNGAYAEGVVGVVPTLTYPSHTTLATGVWPIEHGVFNNKSFAAPGTGRAKQLADASMIQVGTIWEAAKKAGYSTASVGWPITSGSPWIDYLMPADTRFEGNKEITDPKLIEEFRASSALRAQLDKEIPASAKAGVDLHRFAWTLAVLRRYHPEFMTTHLGELDHFEHLTGPFTEESNSALEMLDGEVKQLIELERSIDPNAYIVVVSDHGFAPVEKTVNLQVLFRKAGLLPAEGQPEDAWTAALWISDATAAVILKNPADRAAVAKVAALLDEAAKNPEFGIARVLTHEQVVERGGYPKASFMIELKPGFIFGGKTSGEIVTPKPRTGTHGFLPDRPELRASFLILGPNVAAGKNLGLVDMRQIAPTVARILGAQLPAAKLAPLPFEQSTAIKH